MPLVALAIASAAAGGVATAYGAHKSSESADAALKASTASNAAAIAEQQRQDAQQQQNFDKQQAAAKAQWDAEQSIRAPYRQAGSAALSSLGGILGVDFGSGGGGSSAGPATPAANGPMPKGIDWTADPSTLTKQLTGYYQSAGVPATEVPYWVKNAASLVARGKELNDPLYADKRLAASEIFGGGPSARMTPITALMPKPLAPPIQPMMGNPLAPSYNPVVPITSLMGAR